ncbi:MAG: purine-nucleoside phosphorylase [Candidatus Cloacimonetes bacterium]|nr:purine-nucleoside phosphorylase [Candidatus Cloacimonadota bacterium]
MYLKTIEYLKKQIPFKPICAIILGTGLNALADNIEDKIEIPYEKIPGFVKSTAPSHQGKLVAGYINKKPVIVFKGRYHYYEGYVMNQVVFPVRIAKLFGVDYLFVTNAAGSLNEDLKPGQLVVIDNHINMMPNPLIGENEEMFGMRFPSMHEPYSKQLTDLAFKLAEENSISLKKGVYCAVTGPSLETKAECLMIKNWGADLVGMSTVPEVITAVHCGLKVFAVSVVTNLSNIFHTKAHTQEEIRDNADKASRDLFKLFNLIIEKI